MARVTRRTVVRRAAVSAALAVAAVAVVVPAVAEERATGPGCQASEDAREDPPGVARDDCETVETEPEPGPPGPAPEPPAPVGSPAPSDTAVLSEQMIQRDGQIVTASGPEGSNGIIELQFGDDTDLDLEVALSRACEALAAGADGQPVRLAPNMFVVDPSGFDPGDEVVVTSTVPVEEVRQDLASYDGASTGDLQVGSAPGDARFDTAELLGERLAAIRANRALPADPRSDEIWVMRLLAGTRMLGDARTSISAKATYWSPASFGVCFAGEKPSPGDLNDLPAFRDDAGDETGLYGPVLLPTCSTDTGAPCVEQRTATADGAVKLVTRIPAEDPWMR